MNYILKGAAHVCPVDFLSEAFHPSRFPSCHLFSCISSSEFHRPSQISLLLLCIKGGRARLVPALCPVPLGATRCCVLPAISGLLSMNPTGCWFGAAHPSVCSVGLGLRAAKDRFGSGGWLSPGCPGASVLQHLPRGLLPRLSCFLPGAPLDIAASPGGWSQGQRHKVPGRSRDRSMVPRHTSAVTLVPSPPSDSRARSGAAPHSRAQAGPV